MNKVRCNAGHFYDSDKFKECPVCNPIKKEDVNPADSRKGKTRPLGDMYVDEDDYPKEVVSTYGPVNVGITYKPPGSEMPKGVTYEPPGSEMPKGVTYEPPGSEMPKGVTYEPPGSEMPKGVTYEPPGSEMPKGVTYEPPGNEIPKGVTYEPPGGEIQRDIIYETVDNGANIKKDDTITGASLSSEIAKTGSTEESILPKTVSFYDKIEPTVGWLVCIDGYYQGCSFELNVGKNRIGRNSSMEVNLIEDVSITRETHAVVIYDPQHRKFYIQTGTSDGLVYCNENLIFSHEELKNKDKISIGNAKFIFIPLCGEDFSWDDYIGKEGL